MADRIVPGPVDSNDCIKETVCINTRKILDSCRDKDCVEDLRVYPTASSAPYIDNAISVRARCAELLYCSVNVEEICLNRGYYTVDVTYFYRVTGETFPGNMTLTGLAIFDKRVMLFGSEGRLKTFGSSDSPVSADRDMPYAVVDAVDPIALHMSIVDPGTEPTAEARDIPQFIRDEFGEDILLDRPGRQISVTLGQFSIIRLERSTQLLIPAYDYCMPEKECIGSTEDDPCTMFSRIRFPVEEFFPPDSIESCDDYRSLT